MAAGKGTWAVLSLVICTFWGSWIVRHSLCLVACHHSAFDAPVVLCVASGSRWDELRVLILPAPQPPRPGFPAGSTSRFQALAARTLGCPSLCTHCPGGRTLEKQILKNVLKLLFPIQI